MQVSTGFAHPIYLDSVRLSERDITTDQFEIGPGLLPFRVVLKTGGGRVRGTVEEGGGAVRCGDSTPGFRRSYRPV